MVPPPAEGTTSEEAVAPEELEKDALADPRARVEESSVALKMAEATLNVLPSTGGVLTTLKQGAFQHLVASVRTTAGLKAGRYFFEAQLLESTAYPENHQGTPLSVLQSRFPRQVLRVGFGLGDTLRFLGDGEETSVSFDSDGFFAFGARRQKVCPKLAKGQTMAVLLNLDGTSPNANTVSLFVDGNRATQPLPLPESLVGQALFPTITYRNSMLKVNLGPTPQAPLPFECRMVQDAAAEDVELCPEPPIPSDGKHEVVFAVGMPDHGLFEWADQFLEANPQFTELSDRTLLTWAAKSGLWFPKAHPSSPHSRDKPPITFPMEQGSASTVIREIAPMLKRDFLVLEMKANLLPQERKKALLSWRSPHFRKVASVAMGEPTAEYKSKVQELMLADAAVRQRMAKRKRDKQAERAKFIENKKRMCQQSKKERAERAQREREKHLKKPPAKEGEVKEEAMEEANDEVKEEVKEEEKDDVKQEDLEGPPELSAAEQKAWFRKSLVPDMTQAAIFNSFSSWALPTEAEGFDDVRFEWDSAEKCDQILRDFVSELKRTQRVEDLQPHPWFKDKFLEFQSTLKGWRTKQGAYKASLKDKKKDESFDPDLVDVSSVENVCDIGNGEPLFASFEYEDWLLLTARAEMHLLAHSYRKALDDPEREAILEKDLPFYYDRHFQKQLRLGAFECTKLAELLELISDSAVLDDQARLIPACDEDTSLEQLLRQTEERRRQRQLRIDAGDESARLKFKQPQQPAGRPKAAPSSAPGLAAAAAAKPLGTTVSSPAGASIVPTGVAAAAKAAAAKAAAAGKAASPAKASGTGAPALAKAAPGLSILGVPVAAKRPIVPPAQAAIFNKKARPTFPPSYGGVGYGGYGGGYW